MTELLDQLRNLAEVAAAVGLAVGFIWVTIKVGEPHEKTARRDCDE